MNDSAGAGSALGELLAAATWKRLVMQGLLRWAWSW